MLCVCKSSVACANKRLSWALGKRGGSGEIGLEGDFVLVLYDLAVTNRSSLGEPAGLLAERDGSIGSIERRPNAGRRACWLI